MELGERALFARSAAVKGGRGGIRGGATGNSGGRQSQIADNLTNRLRCQNWGVQRLAAAAVNRGPIAVLCGKEPSRHGHLRADAVDVKHRPLLSICRLGSQNPWADRVLAAMMIEGFSSGPPPPARAASCGSLLQSSTCVPTHAPAATGRNKGHERNDYKFRVGRRQENGRSRFRFASYAGAAGPRSRNTTTRSRRRARGNVERQVLARRISD